MNYVKLLQINPNAYQVIKELNKQGLLSDGDLFLKGKQQIDPLQDFLIDPKNSEKLSVLNNL